MSRTFSRPGDEGSPKIDHDSVLDFFEQRATRIGELGPVRAVIYQDKNPNLADRRDKAEKQRIRPLLQLDGSQRLLDVGCGTGRWVSELAATVASYHGVDVTPGLVDYAREEYGQFGHCRFSVASVTDLSLELLDESRPFDRILCAGVLVYLNDDGLAHAFDAFGDMAARNCLLMIREPMGLGQRLTISHHFSDELEQHYNAIYRTEAELIDMIVARLGSRGFNVTGTGDVYVDSTLNNRAETKQRWILVRRSP